MSHVHELDRRTMTCAKCGATAEQIYRGEAAHPGKPTSERLWDLYFKFIRLFTDNSSS